MNMTEIMSAVNDAQNTQTDEFGYVPKGNLCSFQIFPVPTDLENWYKVRYDPDKSYINKKYNPLTRQWDDFLDMKTVFNYEKRIALLIKEDFDLGIDVVTDIEWQQVKDYLAKISPNNSQKEAYSAYQNMVRPQIMYRYEGRTK